MSESKFSNPPKLRRVKAKITRTVTEIVICTLNEDGCVEEVDEVHEELDWTDAEVHSIHSVFSNHP